ncbi:MAG TPA: LytTR family DNA-binding domain-containing protein [Puia sp.]|nr:LytTR family DNA-binding domain-containing protein [Puia sp.]
MRVIIIEDEAPAANRLGRMLRDLGKGIEVARTLDSVEAAVGYLGSMEAGGIDLLFMDIQLADGISFSIFEQVQLSQPVIFTTAFDHYVLKAFKVNSIDYLLKPVDAVELAAAVEKYQKLHVNSGELAAKIDKLVHEMSPSKYRERLLIKRGQQLTFLKTSAMAHCHADGKLCYATDFNGASFLLDNNLQQLEASVNPRQFYRVNRQLLVNIEAIRKVYTWLGGRLKLELAPPTQADTIVSRERVGGFKDWMGQ